MGKTSILILGGLLLIGCIAYVIQQGEVSSGTATNSVAIESETTSTDTEISSTDDALPIITEASVTDSTELAVVSESDRQIFLAESITLPLSGSAPISKVRHTIPIEEIRQGCFRQDCIPSIDDPSFISVSAASSLVQDDDIGIALNYKGENRFYPFPMLETHELVNDVVAGDPLLVSYCPLCGTGIVFSRELDGQTVEFGVSGMLWQSNLLMYNRADALGERNLWSQVLGEAVVGERAGQKLDIVSSDIQRFGGWASEHPTGQVLAGDPRDPYDGRYYEVARNFRPNFDEQSSPIAPDAYVYGISVNGIEKAYPLDTLPPGSFTDTVGGEVVEITNDGGVVQFTTAAGEVIPDIEGFWFSWAAAHPDTELYR